MKIIHLFVVIIVSAFLCSGCGFLDQQGFNEPQPTYEYTKVYQRFSEPYGSGFILQGDLPQVIVGDHTYVFESTILEEDRSAFVSNQEELCRLLEKEDISTTGLTFRILADYPNRAESENRVAYYGLDSIKSWEQIFTTAQLCMGDYTNIGYLYAFSNRIASDLEWACDDAFPENEQVFSDDPSLLNLVYPCFSEKYSDTESIVACKALSIELLAATEDIWSEAEFLRARETYAKKKNIDFAPTYLTFAYNGESCPLKLSCQYLEVFWDYTFVANYEYLAGWIPTDYTEGVSGLIHTFELLDEQLTALCKQLSVSPSSQVPVQMMETLPRGYISPYRETGGIYSWRDETVQIFSTTVTVLAHEYVHHIYRLLGGANDPNYKGWHNEAVAYYYTFGQAYEYHVNIINNVDPSYRQRLEEKIGEAYDEPSDYIKFLRIEMREKEEREYINYLKSGSDLSRTFGEYFVRTFGEKSFLNSMLYPSRVKEFTGSSMDEIIEAWCADMKNPEND